MSALGSPLEALAFDHLSFGLFTVVNNVWTWVAVITAAVSVWRFKASSLPGAKFPHEATRQVERLAAEPALATAAVAPSIVETAKPSTAVAPSSPSPCLFNAEGRTSGKFTFYYDRREEEEDRGDDVNGEADGEEGCIGGEKQWVGVGEGWWEVTMRMRMGDHMGFYSYQDLTVLDGSVVRLWDGCRRRRSEGSSCAPLISCGGGEGGTILW